MPVDVDIARQDGVLRLALAGDLDMSTAAAVEERLLELEDGEEADRMVLDLRGLRFIDSTGLSLLLNAHGRGRKAGRRVTIVSGSGPPRRILETTGLTGQLDVVEE